MVQMNLQLALLETWKQMKQDLRTEGKCIYWIRDDEIRKQKGEGDGC